MTDIRTMVVDDEPAARKGIKRLLEADPEIEFIGEAANGTQAVERISELRPDLVFLDVQMPELDGFQVLGKLGARNAPVIVFVTAYDQFALRAFEVQALDYILKPFDDDRFATVLERAKQHVRNSRTSDLGSRLESLLATIGTDRHGASESGSTHLSRILIREAGTVTFQPVETIDWIEAADYYAKLHIGNGIQLVRYTMNDLEKQLDPRRFVRVHRSAIVNVLRVKEIRLDYQNHHIVVMSNGVRVPLSRSRKDYLEEVLSKAR